MQRSCVICPQGDVSCTYGAFHAAEPLFRLKVRGERLKAGIFYRFALNYFVTATLAAYFVHISSYPYYVITM